MSELKADMEAGRISVKDVTDAFIYATSEGGKFYGMLERQAEGLKGSFAYLKGSISSMMNDIGESVEGPVAKGVTLAGDLVKNYREVGETLGVLVSMYGSYKAAQMVNAALELSTIGRLRKLAAAKQLLIAIQSKLNATMLANPYGVAAAGVIALTYAIYKNVTARTDEQKSLENAEKAAAAHQAELMKELRTLNELKGKLEKAKKGSEEWKSAKDAIVSQFGKYHSGLDEEIQKTGNLTRSYEELTKAIRMSAAARAMEDFDQKNGFSETETEYLGKIHERLTSGKLQKRIKDAGGHSVLSGNVVVAGKALEQLMQKVNEYERNGDKSIFSKKELDYLQQGGNKSAFNCMNSLRGKYIANESGRKSIAERYGTNLNDLGNFVRPDNGNSSGKDRSEEIEELIKSKKTALKKLKKDSKEHKKLTAEIDSLIAEQKTYGDYDRDHKSTKSSGATADQIASKQTEAHQKLLDLMKQQTEERLKLRQDYEYQEWQNRIDLMDDGEAKILAQMELDNKKELSSLEDQKQQAIKAEISRQKAIFDAKEDEKAAGNKKYAKQIFDPGEDIEKTISELSKLKEEIITCEDNIKTLSESEIIDSEDLDEAKKKLDEFKESEDKLKIKLGNISPEEITKITERYDNLQTQLLQKQEKAEQDRLDSAKESMNAYLKEFGSYQEKRLAIQEEYETKISKAKNEGERMQFMAQRNKALSDLDYDEWVDTGTVALAFGDITKLSDKTISQLISDMEKYREKVIQTFDPDKIEKYEQALSGLRKVQSDKSFGIFSSSIPDYFKDRKSTADQMDSAGKNVNELYNQRANIYNRILTLKERIADAKENGEDTSKLNDELGEAEVELSANAKAAKSAQDSFRILQEQWDQLETPQAKFEALCTGIASVSDLIGGLANKASQMAEAMGADGAAEALGYLGDALGSVSNIASGFANGGVIGGIAAAAGEIMGWIGKISSAGDNRHQKNIEALQDQIDALEKSYKKLGKAVDDAFSTDASHLIDQQNTMLEQQKVLIKQQMAEEEAKKKTDDEKIKQWNEQLEEIDETLAENKKKAKEAIIGEDLKSAINEFASLYAEAWASGKNAAQKSMEAVKNIVSSAFNELLKKNIQPAATKFYDYLASALERGLTESDLDILDNYKKQMDAAAARYEEQYKMIQERYRDLDEIMEDLTDISFDSVRDNFKSKLADMSSSAKDFTDDFSDMLRNALIDGLMDTKYDNMLKEWYDEFAEAMNNRSLTDSERDALRQKYDDIVRQGLEDRDFINSIVGGGAYSQEASKGWSTTLTQDQGDELNGRFTALTELEAINNTLVSEGNMIAMQILDTLRSLSSLSMVTDGDNSTMREIRDMMFHSTDSLEDISKYTKLLIKIQEGIDKLNDLINQRL